jgi:hypothetical protein
MGYIGGDMKMEHSSLSIITKMVKGMEYIGIGIKREQSCSRIFMKTVSMLNASNINYHEIRRKNQTTIIDHTIKTQTRILF